MNHTKKLTGFSEFLEKPLYLLVTVCCNSNKSSLKVCSLFLNSHTYRRQQLYTNTHMQRLLKSWRSPRNSLRGLEISLFPEMETMKTIRIWGWKGYLHEAGLYPLQPQPNKTPPTISLHSLPSLDGWWLTAEDSVLLCLFHTEVTGNFYQIHDNWKMEDSGNFHWCFG